MQIKLEQGEIVTALKQYIAQQGFNLTGKSVDISFTAGRNPAGLSADVKIEDVEIPGVAQLEAERPTLSVVKAAQEVIAEAKGEPHVEEHTAEDTPPFDGGTKVEGEPKKTTTSLFG